MVAEKKASSRLYFEPCIKICTVVARKNNYAWVKECIIFYNVQSISINFAHLKMCEQLELFKKCLVWLSRDFLLPYITIDEKNYDKLYKSEFLRRNSFLLNKNGVNEIK